MQNPHVLLARATPHGLLQRIECHAEAAGREQVIAVAITLKRARLANQPVDDVPVIYVVFLPAHESWQSLHTLLAVPHLQVLGVDPHVDPLADQTAVH